MAFFTGKNLKFIMALLNSKLIYKYVEMIVHQYGFTGLRLSNQYVEIMTLLFITSKNHGIVIQIQTLVDKILAITNVTQPSWLSDKGHKQDACDTIKEQK